MSKGEKTQLVCVASDLSSLLVKYLVLHCMCQGLTKAGSLFRQASVNSLKLFEKSPVSVGGGNLGMWKRTRMGCMSELGGSPLASSMAVMPKDQISTWRRGNTQQQLLLNARQVVFAVRKCS